MSTPTPADTRTLHFGPDFRPVSIGNIVTLSTAKPFRLDCGAEISSFPLAYRTYGRLNAGKNNAVLICHALTADQYVADTHPVTGKPGWWERMVGRGKPIDTEKYFVICSNVLGGCMGSFSPKDINPATDKPYGLSFPVVTIADMVRAQALLLDHFGIDRLFACVGASMGGMQVLEWVRSYPNRVFAALPIATATRQSPQNIAFHEIGRQAIMADPDWREGNYAEAGAFPARGLAVARMAAHVTYLSEAMLQEKFGRNLQDREDYAYGFDADFRIESYLRHQGQSFVERFDANSYLYLTRAASYFDLSEGSRKHLAELFRGVETRFCVISFTSDWLFPTPESRHLVRALNAAGASVSFAEIASDKGHDAFLLDEPDLDAAVRGFLEGCVTLQKAQG